MTSAGVAHESVGRLASGACRRLVPALAAITLASPAAGQVTTTLADLPLRVNLGDTVTVTGPTDEPWRGRVLDMGADGLTLQIGRREVVLAPADVRTVTTRRHDSLTNGAWIGFFVYATPWLAAASNASGDASMLGALVAGSIGAAIGAGVDSLIGRRAVVLQMSGEDTRSLAGRTGPLAGLADRINLGDTVTVRDAGSRRWHGDVVRMTGDQLVLRVGEDEVMLGPSEVQRVKMCCDGLRNGRLIGLVSGAVVGGLAAAASDGSDAGDVAGVGLIFGLIGSVAGLGIDALIAREVDVYRSAPPVAFHVVADPVNRRVAVVLRW